MPSFDNEPDLFSQANGDESGYEQWRKDAAEARRKGLLKGEANELPIAADATGFERWRVEREEAKRAFDRRWGVPLGRRVRVRLKNGSEFEGLLAYLEKPGKESAASLSFSVGARAFLAKDVMSIVRLD